MLEQSNGSARIDQIAAELKVSERTLCRRFQRIVGMTPKYFGQVRQINYAVEMLMADDVAALTAIAHQGGFYDQSHFIKAMHTFFEQGHQQFLNSRDPELATFLGKSRRRDGGGTERTLTSWRRFEHRRAGAGRWEARVAPLR